MLDLHPLGCVSHCCHEMPEEQLWGREMGNAFGAFGDVCVTVHHSGGSTAAGGSEAVGACRCLLTPQQMRKQREMTASAQLTASLFSLEAKHLGTVMEMQRRFIS